MFSGPACQEVKEVNGLPSGFAAEGLGVTMMGSVFLLGYTYSEKVILRVNMTTGGFKVVRIPELGKELNDKLESEHARKIRLRLSRGKSWVQGQANKRSIDKIFEQPPAEKGMIEDLGSFSDSSDSEEEEI